MTILKTEKKSEKWFGVTILLLSIMLIFSSLGKTNWLVYISGAFSILLGFILYIEGGVRDYLRRKAYKNVSTGDFIVWASFIFGTFLIINGITLFLGDLATGWFFSFVKTNGVIGGTISGILAIFLLLIPRPKA